MGVDKMNIRTKKILLPFSNKEKEFLLNFAKKTNLSLSDLFLLSVLSLQDPKNISKFAHQTKK